MLKDEKGQSLTELALLLPILLLLVCGIIDLGRVMYGYMHIHLAVQESVRLAGLGGSDAEIRNFAREYVHLSGSSELEVDISPSEANRKPGQYVTVKLSITLPYMTPVVGNLLSPAEIRADSTIRVE